MYFVHHMFYSLANVFHLFVTFYYFPLKYAYNVSQGHQRVLTPNSSHIEAWSGPLGVAFWRSRYPFSIFFLLAGSSVALNKKPLASIYLRDTGNFIVMIKLYIGNNIAIIAYMLGLWFFSVNSHNSFIYITLFTHLWAHKPTPAPKPTICQ